MAEEKRGWPGEGSEDRLVAPTRRERVPEPPAPRPPARYRIDDVLTRRTLGEDLEGPAMLALLAQARSSVDVRVSVRHGDGPWHAVPLHQQRQLWERARALKR
jgi:hypothetical protein